MSLSFKQNKKVASEQAPFQRLSAFLVFPKKMGDNRDIRNLLLTIYQKIRQLANLFLTDGT